MRIGWERLTQVYQGNIEQLVSYAWRSVRLLTAIQVGLLVALVSCWEVRWPLIPLPVMVCLMGITASVSMWSALYQLRKEAESKTAFWQLFASEQSDEGLEERRSKREVVYRSG